MAEIRPLKAWRYGADAARDIGTLTSPLFDVVTEKQREALYRNPLNSIHLSVPQGPEPAVRASELLRAWKENGVLSLDLVPGIYVYYQYFFMPGSSKEYCRKGFICNVKAYDWSENIILRHENTIPQSVNDRIEILEKTLLNASPTHGLYTDPLHSLEPYMDESMLAPIYETEDYQGVRDVLSVIHDARVIRKFIDVLAPGKIILADGHHRYEGSLEYRKKKMKENPDDTGKEAYHYHMMYLTNSESDDLRILPTHRLITGFEDLSREELLQRLSAYFDIKEQEDPYGLDEIISGKKWAFGLVLKDGTYKLRLKPEAFEAMDRKFPECVRNLDLTVMHYFIIDRVLEIPLQEQRSSPKIHFSRSFSECLTNVMTDKARLALITNAVSMEEVKEVCYSGYLMPQKSTYFYPKAICGFLFGSLVQHEFESPVDPCFEVAEKATDSSGSRV